ncbi:hypothetical protein GS508_00865 [Rhodococcus hoagii]|nr:hypothetical protein [Prescottella equi]NKS99571.1 hypothetical protein [Prescottella equi]
MVNVLNRELDADATPMALDVHKACQRFLHVADSVLHENGDVWGADATALSDLRSYINSLGLFLSSRSNGELISSYISEPILRRLVSIINGAMSVRRGKGVLGDLQDALPKLRSE